MTASKVEYHECRGAVSRTQDRTWTLENEAGNVNCEDCHVYPENINYVLI